MNYIKQLKAKNVFCFDDIDITFNEEDRNILILGKNLKEGFVSNGSGKSSIVNAISWCLKGKIPTDSILQDEIIKLNKEDCSVEITFSDGFKIKRSRKRGKTSSVSPSQEEIDTYLGIKEFIDFLNLVYITDAGIDKLFSSRTMDNSKKLDLISRIQNLTSIDNTIDGIQKEQKDKKKKIAELSAKVDQNDKMLVTYTNTDISYYKGKIRLEELETKKLKTILDEIETQIDSLGDDLGDPKLFAEIKTKSQKWTDKSEEKSKKKTRIADIEKELSGKTQELIQKEYDEIREEQKEVEANIYYLRSSIKTFNKQLSSEPEQCPNCKTGLFYSGKEIVLYDKDNVKKQIELYQSGIKSDNKLLANIILELDELKLLLDLFEEKKESEQECKDILIYMDELHEEITELEKELEGKNQEDTELLEKYKKKQKDLQERIQKSSNRVVTHKATIEALDVLNNEQCNLNEQLEDEEQYNYKLTFWKTGFKELRRRMVESFLPEFEEYCNEFLKQFGSDFTVELSTMEEKSGGDGYKERFSFTLFDSVYGTRRSVRTASLGENKRLMLSNFTALRKIASLRNNNNCGFILVDEILDNNMDYSGVMKFFDILNLTDHQKLVISNNDGLADHFDRVICVNKEGDKTWIEEEKE